MSDSVASPWDALQARLSGAGLGDTGGERETVTVPVRHVRVPSTPPSSGTSVSVCTILITDGPGQGYCGGRVGGGSAKFCTLSCIAGSVSCRFAAHAQKASLAFPAYYICTPKTGVAFTEPRVLPSEGIFPPLVVAAMSDTRTFREWHDVFAVINCFPEEMDDDERIAQVSRATRPLAIGLTPMVNRRSGDSTSDLEREMLNVADSESWGGVKTLRSCLLEDFVDDGDLLSHVNEHWNVLTKAVITQESELGMVDKNIRGLLEEVDNKVLRTSTALGVPTEDVPALTVWGSITEVCKDLIKHGAKLTDRKSVV